MDIYLRVSVLFTLFMAATPESESPSRQGLFPLRIPTADCDCITVQSKLNQMEHRVSKMFDQLQKTYSMEMHQLEHRVSELLNLTALAELEQRVTHLSEQLRNGSSTDSFSSVAQFLDQLQNKMIRIDKRQTLLLSRMEERVVYRFDQLQNEMESTINSHFGELYKTVENLRDKDNAKQNSSALEAFWPVVSGIKVPYVDTRFGSQWIIVLENNEKANFNKRWHAYRNGFGKPNNTTGGFWLGLENLYQLTSNASYELAVEMTDLEGDTRYARYSRFRIAGEDQHYKLLELGTHSGTAGDGLSAHLNYGFSTSDNGTGMYCSRGYGLGGWWFIPNECYDTSLTANCGRSDVFGAVWGKFKKEEKLTYIASAIMMIRAT